MSASFTRQLRSRRPAIDFEGGSGADALHFRVQSAELWDAVRVTASPSTTVGDVKGRALKAFFPAVEYPEDYVLKLRGWEMLDEGAPIGESGVEPGSVILLGLRRRIPVW